MIRHSLSIIHYRSLLTNLLVPKKCMHSDDSNRLTFATPCTKWGSSFNMFRFSYTNFPHYEISAGTEDSNSRKCNYNTISKGSIKELRSCKPTLILLLQNGRFLFGVISNRNTLSETERRQSR